MSDSFPSRRLIASVLLFSLASCTTARLIPDSARYVQERRPIRVSVVLESGPEVTLEAPAVFQDSLIGLDAQGRPASIAVADVEGIRIRAPSTPHTIALVTGLTAGLALLLFAAGGGGPAPSVIEEPEEDHVTLPLHVGH